MNDQSFVSKVKRPPSAFVAVYRPLMAVLTVVYGGMSYYNPWMIFLTVLCGLVFLWLLFFTGKAWYEYRLDNAGFSVILVKQNGKRKTMLNLAADQIQLVAKSKSELLRPYMKDGKRIFMRDLASGKKPESEYVIVWKDGEKVSMALVELDSEMKKQILSFFPEKTEK